MPPYKDKNGKTLNREDYPGDSFRAKVIARALRNSDFLWVEVPPQSGSWQALFQCCQCKQYTNDAGVAGDHNIASAQGGSDDMWNLQILCNPCNEKDQHHRSKKVTTRSEYRKSGKWGSVHQ